MPRGGARPGAGKPRGPNRSSRERLERISKTGVTPLDVLIEGMRKHYDAAQEALKVDDKETAAKCFREAKDFAKEAAPYLHPRLQAVQHTGKDGGAVLVKITGSDSGLL